MLSKKSKIIIGVALAVSILTSCSKSETSLIEKALSVDMYADYLSNKIDNINDLASAKLKVAYALQMQEWSKSDKFTDIEYKPLNFKSSVSKLSKNTIVELSNDSIGAKSFLLTESETSFVIKYLYTLLINDSGQIYVALNNQQKSTLINTISSLVENIKSADIIEVLSVYESLADKSIDWSIIENKTNKISKMAVLNQRAKKINEIKVLGITLQNNLSTEVLSTFIQNNKSIFNAENSEQSLLPIISYSLVTKPFKNNFAGNKAQANSYLDYIILKNITRLSEEAISLKSYHM